MAVGYDIEFCLLYIGAILADLCEIWTADVESHANTGHHMTETAILENSTWRSATISKIVFNLYLTRESSDFDQIWYADVNFHSENGQLMNSRNFALKMATGRHIENRLYLGANLADLREIFIGDAESHADIVYVTKTAIFDNST